MPASRTKREIARILKEEGFIADVLEERAGPSQMLRIEQLKYVDGKVPVVSGLKRISKPGLRVYAQKTDIPRVLGGLGIGVRQHVQGDHDREPGQAGPARRRDPRVRLVSAMSRIGRLPIPVPAGVDIEFDGRIITVQWRGPR